MANISAAAAKPPQQSMPLLTWASDEHLSLLVFPCFFWFWSLVVAIIEWADVLQQYRLRTSTEEARLNKVSRRDCFFNVVINQIIQILAGLATQTLAGPDDGESAWDAMAQWLGSHAKSSLSLTGINIFEIASKYPGPVQRCEDFFIKTMRSCLVPAFQFYVALFVADTWQYFTHRWCHTNKYIYSRYIRVILRLAIYHGLTLNSGTIHSMHHRLYAPYSFGGQYVHPLESLIMDTIGNLLSVYVSGISVRVGMIFSAYVAFKFVSDHCGYILPFNPVHLVTSNDTSFHDIHHQSWGLKVCG